MLNWSLAILSVFILFMILWNHNREKRLWNNGICSSSGKPWIFIRQDFDGDYEYTDKCGNFLWTVSKNHTGE